MRYEERFWSRVDASGDCWEWTGARSTAGYGQIRIDGTLHYSHRLAWELLVGPIPEGMVTDHLCRNRCCLNPDHLEIVTPATNARRGVGLNNSRRRHRRPCVNGHPFSEDNLYVRPNGHRECRACVLERGRARKAALRQAA